MNRQRVERGKHKPFSQPIEANQGKEREQQLAELRAERRELRGERREERRERKERRE